MLDKFKTLLSDNKDAKEEEFEASQLAVASLMVTTALHDGEFDEIENCLLYTSPSPRDKHRSRMPSSA